MTDRSDRPHPLPTIALAAMLALCGCESVRDVRYPNGVATTEKGKCRDLAPSEPTLTCTDHHLLSSGGTAVLVGAIVVGVLVAVFTDSHGGSLGIGP
jgi:hypothetical protein